MNSNKKTFYITSPLYYVNDVPHIGSAYTTIACDCISRFYKLKGFDTCFLTGTDEHGQKIFKAATENKKTPEEHCNFIAGEFKKLWEKLNIEYDRFSRTTSKNHSKIVQEFFKKVYEKGDIYEGSYEGLYCEACEDFKLEKDLLEGNICPVHKQKAQEYKEKNYFFALSKYQNKLEDYLSKNPDFVQPDFRKNEVIGWIKEGLKDFPISRRQVKWGIPLPVDNTQTIYVWFDALLGYLSGLINENEDCNLEDAIKHYWPASVHIIGKDILRFHAVYWPCMLMSAELPLPKTVFGHGFLTKDGEKMGKTTGNIIDPYELVNKYGIDAVRFFFLREINFGKDGDYTEANFINRINSDLANNLGNLLNRTLTLVEKNFGGVIGPTQEEDSLLKEATINALEGYEESMKRYLLKDALDKIWSLIDTTNKVFNDKKPWNLIKTGEMEKAKVCLYETLEILRNISIVLYPFIPETSQKMYFQLGYDRLNKYNEWEKVGWKKVRDTFKIKLEKPIFPRIEHNSK